MRIFKALKFAQSLPDFFTSKTNLTMILSTVGTIYGFTQGVVSFGELSTALTVAFGGFGVRDAIAKL